MYPKIPGQGMMLYYMAFAMCYSPLPSMVSVIVSSSALLMWIGSLLYQLTSPPMDLNLFNAFSEISLEIMLLGLLMMLCFFQNWYRENYARWDYLQREILTIQRTTLLENKQTSSRLLESMLPATIIEKLKTGQVSCLHFSFIFLLYFFVIFFCYIFCYIFCCFFVFSDFSNPPNRQDFEMILTTKFL